MPVDAGTAAAIGAVGSAAAAGISAGLGGGSGTESSSNQSSGGSRTPFLAQEGNDVYGEEQATNVYQTQQNTGAYPGSYYAGINPTQTGAINQAAGYASGLGNTTALQDASIGNMLTGAAAPNYLGNAGALAGGTSVAGPNGSLAGALSNYANGSGSGLSSALNSAAMSGAQSIGNYNSALGSIIAQGTADPTQQLAGDAQGYMESSAVQNAVNATNAQIGQTLNEQTLPGINRAAAMGGDLNSSRAGAANAEAQEGAAIAQGQADASILNNAYNTGLSTAAGQRTAGLATADNAASTGLASNGSLALGAGNQQVSAAASGLSSNLGYEGLQANTQLAGNAQLGNALTTGLTAGQAGTAQQGALYQLGSTAGGLLQSNDQGQLTNGYNQWLMNNGYGDQILNEYLTNSQIPQGFYNTTGNVTGDGSTVNTSSLGQQIGGGVGAISGILSNYFGGKGGNGSPGSGDPDPWGGAGSTSPYIPPSGSYAGPSGTGTLVMPSW